MPSKIKRFSNYQDARLEFACHHHKAGDRELNERRNLFNVYLGMHNNPNFLELHQQVGFRVVYLEMG
jgi:hypothetical protein